MAVMLPTQVFDVFVRLPSLDVGADCGRLNAEGHLMTYLENRIEGIMHIYPTMRNSTIPRPVTIDRGPRIYLSMKGDVGNIVKWMVVRLRRRTGSFATSAV